MLETNREDLIKFALRGERVVLFPFNGPALYEGRPVRRWFDGEPVIIRHAPLANVDGTWCYYDSNDD